MGKVIYIYNIRYIYSSPRTENIESKYKKQEECINREESAKEINSRNYNQENLVENKISTEGESKIINENSSLEINSTDIEHNGNESENIKTLIPNDEDPGDIYIQHKCEVSETTNNSHLHIDGYDPQENITQGSIDNLEDKSTRILSDVENKEENIVNTRIENMIQEDEDYALTVIIYIYIYI